MGFLFPMKNRRHWRAAPCQRQAWTTHKPMCSEAKELSPFLEFRLMPTIPVGCYFYVPGTVDLYT